MDSQIEIYKASDNQVEIIVQFESDSVWLNREQMAKLFGRDIKTIGKHISNIFNDQELEHKSVVAKFATTANDGKTYQVEFYNLDVIISVGYRVKSKQGTQFRQWATKRLKELLVQGYTLNEKRLEQKEQEIKILKNGIQILARSVGKAIENQENNASFLETFAKGLTLLDDYDHERLDTKGLTKKQAVYPTLSDYQNVLKSMLQDFDSAIFGIEKDGGFKSAIAQIEKGFDNQDFYSTLEEKATTLLYLIVKNHAFVDGNKRIAAACFLKFLEQNKMLYTNENKPIISNDTLASLTLFIASSKAEEMETVKKLVISVLNRNK
ncbi:virulence protein RhuM/Fic/DOC family protein [Flavobacterium haoranii]|uniref:Fic/DOC family protein n=1 Tax=Flavobacterium haoranii TaxID=683124 RepID=A0A1M6LSA2_9FLAO|nr:virulence protein RhuM/Fic/DOC family protein [Flavobacterium haoranii]SHJ74148.1 Fic/DOC family protein [Flavobacterium haoranii]